MSKALYIVDIAITARRKREIKRIHKLSHPVILDDTARIPKEDEMQQLRMMTKDSIKKFDEWTFTYEVLKHKFSSNLYNNKIVN